MTRGKDIAERVTRLEAWVDAVTQVIASLDAEGLLTELDEARGGHDDEPGAAG